MPTETIISTAELAELTGEHPRTVQRKAKAGTYPAHKLADNTGAYVFTPEDVQTILSERAA